MISYDVFLTDSVTRCTQDLPSQALADADHLLDGGKLQVGCAPESGLYYQAGERRHQRNARDQTRSKPIRPSRLHQLDHLAIGTEASSEQPAGSPAAAIERYRELMLDEASLLAVDPADDTSKPRKRGIHIENVVLSPPERVPLCGKWARRVD